MARLLADENFRLPTVEALRVLGHDAVTLSELGLAGRALPDVDVLDAATRERRAVLTLDRRDFVRLHGERPAHAGIIVSTFDLDFAALAARIDAALRSVADLAGQLIRVQRAQ